MNDPIEALQDESMEDDKTQRLLNQAQTIIELQEEVANYKQRERSLQRAAQEKEDYVAGLLEKIVAQGKELAKADSKVAGLQRRIEKALEAQ